MSLSDTKKEYVVPLWRAKLAPRYKRAAKAIRIIRRFISRHTKVEEAKVKIAPELNTLIWAQGVNVKIRRIKVKLEKDDEGNILVKPAS